MYFVRSRNCILISPANIGETTFDSKSIVPETFRDKRLTLKPNQTPKTTFEMKNHFQNSEKSKSFSLLLETSSHKFIMQEPVGLSNFKPNMKEMKSFGELEIKPKVPISDPDQSLSMIDDSYEENGVRPLLLIIAYGSRTSEEDRQF